MIAKVVIKGWAAKLQENGMWVSSHRPLQLLLNSEFSTNLFPSSPSEPRPFTRMVAAVERKFHVVAEWFIPVGEEELIH